jgi:hypothetical protein
MNLEATQKIIKTTSEKKDDILSLHSYKTSFRDRYCFSEVDLCYQHIANDKTTCQHRFTIHLIAQ